jgi:hypothetical protein
MVQTKEDNIRSRMIQGQPLMSHGGAAGHHGGLSDVAIAAFSRHLPCRWRSFSRENRCDQISVPDSYPVHRGV